MDALALLAGLAVATALGFALASLCLPRGVGAGLRLSLALGLGLGATSLTAFPYLVAARSLGPGLAGLEVGLAALFAGLAWCRARGSPSDAPGENDAPAWSAAAKALAVAFAVATLVGLVRFLVLSVDEPHGGVDTWSHWNVRARAVFRAGEGWRVAFDDRYSHADYPLLLPLSVARLWTYAGHETLGSPFALGLVFTGATLALLVSAVSLRRGRQQGLLAGLMLLAHHLLVWHGTSFAADPPLGFFILAATVALSLRDAAPAPGLPGAAPGLAASLGAERPGLPLLAGALAACGAWTKNEGWLFFVALVGARGLVRLRAGGGREAVREAAREAIGFAAGALPGVLVGLAFKAGYAGTNDLVAGQGKGATLARVLDPTRYPLIAKWFLEFLVRSPVPLLALYALGVGLEPGRRARDLLPLVLVALMLGGFVLVFVTTPMDLDWHLRYSVNRLYLQLWPTLVYGAFLIVRDPAWTWRA